MGPQRFIIDTDAGVDDGVALLCALKLVHSLPTGTTVRLITASFGNCALSHVLRNIAKCCKMCGAWPEIAKGADRPIVNNEAPADATYFHGQDGFGDVDSSDSAFCHLSSEDEKLLLRAEDNSATDAITRACTEAIEEGASITLITLGPLTNLALALRADTDSVIQRACKKLVIMGGCGNARGNATRVAEFNVHADAEAAALVFAEIQEWDSELVVVGWDTCLRCPLPWSVFDAALSGPSDSVIRNSDLPTLREFVRAICYKSYINERVTDGKRGNDGAVVCDALAVLVALFPDRLVTRSTLVHVEVETRGDVTRGMTVLCEGHSYDGVERRRAIKWIDEVNVQVYSDLFSSMFES